MNRKMIVELTVTACLFMAAEPLYAGQRGQARSRASDRWSHRIKVDGNGDRSVAADEALAAARKTVPKLQDQFSIADQNSDGYVSKDEFSNQQILSALDRNQDGVVSKQEYMTGRAQRAYSKYWAVDSNNDGALSSSEVEQSARDAKVKWDK